MRDKYDEAVAYLTKHPEKIRYAWLGGFTSRSRADNDGSLLFQGASRDGSDGCAATDDLCGCLTLIRGAGENAETPELTLAIRADDRIPTDIKAVGVEHLPVFAEWQRRLDRELNRA